MALVVDSSALSGTQNSYVSLAEMDAYVNDRVPDPSVATAWENLDPNVQAAYLVNSTRALDGMVSWIGEQYSRDQRLKWPRVNAYIENFLLDVVSTPVAVKEATCEMVIWSMTNSGAVSQTSNVQFDMVQVGPVKIDFNQNDGEPTKSYMPEIISQILRDYGDLQNPQLPGGNAMRVVGLIRS